MDNVREDLKEKNIDSTRIGEATRNREFWRSLNCKSLIVSTLMEERKEERSEKTNSKLSMLLFYCRASAISSFLFD